MMVSMNKQTRDVLQLWYSDLDLRKIKIIRGGVIAWFFLKFFKVAAVTLGNSIYLTDKSCKELDLGLLVHELWHVRQQKEMGTLQFYFQYIYDWAAAGFKYSRQLPLEAAAYSAEEEFLEYTKGV